MKHRFSKRWYFFNALVLFAMLVSALGTSSVSVSAAEPTNAGKGNNVQVFTPIYVGQSQPLRSITPDAKPPFKGNASVRVLNERRSFPKVENNYGLSAGSFDPSIVQNKPIAEPSMPAPIANFEGVNNLAGVLPPDTNGDIGYDPATNKKYYVQWVNLYLQMWDVTDPVNPVALLSNPIPGNALWTGTGSLCETNNDGDPIVLFDHLANRWMISQFALAFPDDFHQCIAVSATPDPSGAWYIYDYQVSTSKMNDYPHFGVWPDGYYMTVNQFDGATSSWAGLGVVIFERQAMLQGLPAQMQYIDVGAVTLNYGGALPADLDGPPPPSGTPGYVVEWDDSTWLGDATDTLRIWEVHVDWNNPSNTTFGVNANYDPNYMIATADVDPAMCDLNRSCIPQPDTTSKLDAISDRLMFRLQYRNFGTYQTLVSNHTVDATSSDQAGIHWFELRDVGTGWQMYQEGVYAPDAENRWMGSIAMDAGGNMALGYSVASASTYPSIRYTGRLDGDTLGMMTQGEATLIAGSGSQTSTSSRWGDYSMMGVDPSDDCTFWYTQEYYETTSNSGWQTRIGSFVFPSCQGIETGTLSGVVTDGTNPIAGALVLVTGGYAATTDASGAYSLQLPPGTYDITVSKYGYTDGSATGVVVASASTTTQDFVLALAPTYTVSGVVTDGTTGWPVYASIEISGYPNSPIYTDPQTGAYSVTLVASTYNFTINAIAGGYNELVQAVTVAADTAQDFALSADLVACTAPGYSMTAAFSEDFETFVPTGWAVTDDAGNGWVWDSTSTIGFPNWTDGSGDAAMALGGWTDSGPGIPYDTSIVTSVITTADLPDFMLTYLANYIDSGPGGDLLDLDINVDGSGWVNVLQWDEDHGNLFGTPGDVVQVDLTPYVSGSTSFQLRWRYYNAAPPEWGDWYAQIDQVRMGISCTPSEGLVMGYVKDGNTNVILDNATVTPASGTDVIWVSNPNDTAISSPFFVFGAAAGSNSVTATAWRYGTGTVNVSVTAGAVTWQDIALPAGDLSSDTDFLSFTVSDLAPTASTTFTLSNSGAQAANYRIYAIPEIPGHELTGPFADNTRRTSPKHLNDPDASKMRVPMTAVDAPVIAGAGNVLDSWSTGLDYGWGLGYDSDADRVWVGNIALGTGDDLNYEFTPSGTMTGNTIDTAPWVAAFAADMAYNPLTQTLWQVNVGGDNCIYEMDPVSQQATGNKICPPFGTSERGLAFDPVTDTYYSGSWNDGVINHFDSSGYLLDSASVGLDIAGLAFNPVTRHLFVSVSAPTDSNPSLSDIYVLDVDNGYNIIGQFRVTAGGSHALADLEEKSLGMACDGTLWLKGHTDDPTDTVYRVATGEPAACDWDFGFLSFDQPTGALSEAGGGSDTATITVNLDATGMAPGTHTAYVLITSDTPYENILIPVSITVVQNVPGVGVPADFNGDGKDDIAVFRPSNGTWYVYGVGPVVYGRDDDIPVPADYNGDGKAEYAVFRPSNSTWYIRGMGSFAYGKEGDIPVPGDYNGDGKDDIAVFRPSNSTWYVRGVGPFVYGTVGDVPVPADYNGDGKTDLAVFRPSNSTWYIYGVGPTVYGAAGDIPVPADYNGDGKDDIAVFRPSNGTWYVYGMGPTVYGATGDIPVPGYYNADAKADMAVFRASTNTWYIRGVGAIPFGTTGDILAMPEIVPGLEP